MVRRPTVEGISHVAPFRSRSAYRSLVRRRTGLRSHRRQCRDADRPDRLTRCKEHGMTRSILIGLAAFSITIVWIVTQAGNAAA